MQTSSPPSGAPLSLADALRALNALAAALEWEAGQGLQLVDGGRLARRHHPDIDPARPALVRLGGADRAAIARVLHNQYPPEHPLRWLDAAGAVVDGPASVAELLAAGSMDGRSEPDRARSAPQYLALSELPFPGSMLDLAEVIAHLRAPEGCPWDREQTHRTLRPFLLEEAYEAVEAIDAGDTDQLADELGDVLLQVVLHAQIAVEEGSFSLPRVIQAITEKLVRRHPHVFGEVEAETSAAVIENWEALKREERDAKGAPSSPFSGIPKAMPALARAQAAQRKAERLTKRPSTAFALGRGAADDRQVNPGPEPQPIAREALGPALFALVARAEASGLDAEAALREEVARFLRVAEAEVQAGEST